MYLLFLWRSQCHLGPKKSRFSGPTPSNALSNDVAPLKIISYRAIKTTDTLIDCIYWENVINILKWIVCGKCSTVKISFNSANNLWYIKSLGTSLASAFPRIHFQKLYLLWKPSHSKWKEPEVVKVAQVRENSMFYYVTGWLVYVSICNSAHPAIH